MIRILQSAMMSETIRYNSLLIQMRKLRPRKLK